MLGIFFCENCLVTCFETWQADCSPWKEVIVLFFIFLLALLGVLARNSRTISVFGHFLHNSSWDLAEIWPEVKLWMERKTIWSGASQLWCCHPRKDPWCTACGKHWAEQGQTQSGKKEEEKKERDMCCCRKRERERASKKRWNGVDRNTQRGRRATRRKMVAEK